MDIPSLYVTLTERLLGLLAISHELGHLGGGLLIYLVVLAFTGMRRAPMLPMAAVFIAEGLNETIQANHYGSWRINDTLADIAWTVALPLMLFALGTLGRWRLMLARRPAIFPA